MRHSIGRIASLVIVLVTISFSPCSASGELARGGLHQISADRFSGGWRLLIAVNDFVTPSVGGQFNTRLQRMDSGWEGASLPQIHRPDAPPAINMQLPDQIKETKEQVQQPSSQAPASLSDVLRILVPRWRTLGFYALLPLIIVALTLAEWRWMIARERELRTLVRERTRELEAEKVELLRAKSALVTLASHDSLTGLYNRAAILEVMEHEVNRALEQRSPFAVVLTDLDHFKCVNDSYGHLVGDEVLQEFARRIRRNLRPYDQVGRYGGEELLILMPGMEDEAAPRIHALHQRITEQPFALSGLTLRITCSFGVCWFPAPRDTVESLLNLADQALYMAKANGRNRVEIATQSALTGRSAGGIVKSPITI